MGMSYLSLLELCVIEGEDKCEKNQKKQKRDESAIDL